jgi:hypothetical protein
MLFILLCGQAPAQQPDYRKIFAGDWEKAEEFEIANRHWMKQLIEGNDLQYEVAMAVVFPELVRYSALKDKMETAMLRILYINLGDDYANFSIGQFQVKPSFAEIIRERAAELSSDQVSQSFKTQKEYDDIRDYRKSIVNDLEDTRIQINYLVAFIKLCEKDFPGRSFSGRKAVEFLATAYNAGPGKSEEELALIASQKHYSTKIIKTETYNYADISLYWFDRSGGDVLAGR